MPLAPPAHRTWALRPVDEGVVHQLGGRRGLPEARLNPRINTIMKVLVIGGAGYIGSHVALEFLEQGHQVTVFDIDMSLCCYCNLCTYPCPTHCLYMTPEYEFDAMTR